MGVLTVCPEFLIVGSDLGEFLRQVIHGYEANSVVNRNQPSNVSTLVLSTSKITYKYLQVGAWFPEAYPRFGGVHQISSRAFPTGVFHLDLPKLR